MSDDLETSAHPVDRAQAVDPADPADPADPGDPADPAHAALSARPIGLPGGAADAEPTRHRLACPRCARAVRRRRRNSLQRWLLRDTALARYRCADAGCGWTGLLDRRLDAAAAPAPLRRLRALRGIVPLLLAGVAVLAAQWGARQAPVANVPVGARLFAPGEAFDGDPVPSEHPIMVPASFAPPHEAPSAAHTPASTTAGAADPGARAVEAPPGLAVRRFCAWGRPGRMPYRGSLDDALRAAQVPQVVREQIGAAVAAGRPHDRLVIANDAIRTVSGGISFDASGFAMTYGRTLCLGTRVNFKPGHVEPASLYEAFDDQGQRYSVMVPDVCGNVSVLRPRGEPGARTAGVAGKPRTRLDPLDPGEALPVADKPHEVPEPGTLALALAAMAGLFVARGRSRRETRRTEG